jgi:hypothetical protein
MDDSFSGGGWAQRVVNGIWNRSSRGAALNLGIVDQTLDDESVYRDPELERLDAYYENRQFDKLLPFDVEEDGAGRSIPLRRRQPRMKVAFAKTLCSRVTSKLLGPTVFPSFKIIDFPDDEEYFKAIVRESLLKSFLLEPTRRMLNSGEIFIRFWISGGVFKKEWYHAKYCYPTYQENGELELMRIQYVFADGNDVDTNGKPKMKWFRMDLGVDTEIKYDNPPYSPKEEPQFKPVVTVDHGMGFVQGEYFTTTGEKQGYSLICDVTDFIDELCYSLSQSSKATAYNQDPQLVLNNMTAEETDQVIRSASKAWNLGLKGEAKLIEANMSGVQVAMELRDKVRLNIQDITRIVLLDPEKIVGSAQSAKAMEVLHGPLKDLVDELRMPVGDCLKKLVIKMGVANLMADKQGIEAPIPIPPGYKLQSLGLEPKWPPIFQQTMEDLGTKVDVVTKAKVSGIISTVTALRNVAEDFGIEDQEAELKLIAEEQAAAAALNPFGGF